MSAPEPPGRLSRTVDSDRQQIGAVVGPGQPQRLGQSGRPAGQLDGGAARPGGAGRDVLAVDDLAGPDEHRAGHPDRSADDVGAPVHAVDEVDVQEAGRAEHDRVALGRPTERVRSRVIGALVGLDLGQAHGDVDAAHGTGQARAEQTRRDRPATAAPGRHERSATAASRSRAGNGLGPLGLFVARARNRASCSATRTGAVPP